jgi:hypothetical protein
MAGHKIGAPCSLITFRHPGKGFFLTVNIVYTKIGDAISIEGDTKMAPNRVPGLNMQPNFRRLRSKDNR